MIKLYWYRELINLGLLIAMLIFYLCLKYAIVPSLRAGFFCDDFSITLPFKNSETVNDLWLHLILIALPVIVIVGTEIAQIVFARIKKSPLRKNYLIVLPFNKQFKVWQNIGNCFKVFNLICSNRYHDNL